MVENEVSIFGKKKNKKKKKIKDWFMLNRFLNT
jgi:hypothetical protein